MVVGGGLVAHPGDGGGFCALLDGDGFGSGYGSAAYGDGVLCDAGGHVCGEVFYVWVEV